MSTQRGQTYASRGFRFIHGFYAFILIIKILNGCLKGKLKGASVWPFNGQSKVATGSVCYTLSLYRHCK